MVIIMIKKIIPCLDVKDGRVVKGVSFVDIKDAGDIAENAKFYCENGADELVLLDISATTQSRKTIFDWITLAAKQINIPLSVGGGIRSIEDFEAAFAAGASKVAVNTAAIKDRTLIERAAKKFGSERVICAIDAKLVGENYHVFTMGGSFDTGIDAIEWAKEAEISGAGELLVTSIDADGTKSGFDITLYKLICSSVKIPVTASGGAGTMEHFYEAFEAGAASGLAASLFHFRMIDIKQLKQYLKDKGVNVRD